MRIAIDLTATPKSKTGIGRYLEGLVSGLQQVDQGNEYLLFVQSDDKDGFTITQNNFRIITVNSRLLRKTWLRILWEQCIFPFRLLKYKAEIIHSPNFTMPYLVRLWKKKIKAVATFHDMTYFFLPEYHMGWKRELFKLYIRLTSKCCDHVITISENSKADIKTYCHLKGQGITVTPMGVNQKFFLRKDDLMQVSQKYRIDKKYFIYVGTLEPRKNVPNLIEAYLGLSSEIRSEYKLVICGKKGWLYDEIYERLKLDTTNGIQDIYFPGFVDDNDLPSLLQGASLVLYVSFYEGFGIPVIEGQASRVLTITSFGSSLEEVAGDGALLVNPNQPEDIRSKILWALEPRNAKEKEQIIEKGLERARGYNWENCAHQTISAYTLAYNRAKK